MLSASRSRILFDWGLRMTLLLFLVVGMIAIAALMRYRQPAPSETNSLNNEVLHSGKGAPPTRPLDNDLTPDGGSKVASNRFIQASAERTNVSNKRRTVSGSVLSGTGLPIQGAQVSLTLPSYAHSEGISLARNMFLPVEGTKVVECGADGTFEFSSGDLSFDGAILWASHPGYAAEWRILSDGEVPLAPFIMIEQQGVRVTVVDESGVPLHGATVVTCLADYNTAEAKNAMPGAVRLAFVRKAATGNDGSVLIPAGLGDQYVVAQHGETRSAPWFGRAPADLRLEVTAVVRVSGKVTFRGDASPSWEDMVVTAYSYTPAVRRVIGKAAVDLKGEFGPIALPRDEKARLLIRLDGVGLLPFEREVAFPLPGGHVQIDLEAAAGLQLAINVVDAQGIGVAGADVRAWWSVGDAWVYAQDRTDLEGKSLVFIQPGAVWIQVSALGYREVALPELEFYAAVKDSLLVKLDKAGIIRGKVIAKNEPVSDFHVRYWASDEAIASHHVVDSADGSFLIDTAPIGLVSLVASSASWPASQCESVLVAAGAAVEVVLRLPEVGAGFTGKLVDAYSGEPIIGGHIQAWIMTGGRWVAPSGVDAFSDADGHFALDGLAVGANYLVAEAPGYSRTGSAVIVERDRRSSGDVALVPSGTLEVHLLTEGDLSPSDCTVRLEGTMLDQAIAFSEDGIAEINGVPAGAANVVVALPDGSEVRERSYLRAGIYQRLTVNVGGASCRDLQVVVNGWEDIEGELSVMVSTSTGMDHRSERRQVLTEGRAGICGPFGDAVWIELMRQGETLLVRQYLMSELHSGRVVLPVQRERRVFRVVSRDGEALAGSTVIVAALPETGWLSWGTTDENGRVGLPVPPGRELLLNVQDPRGGGFTDRALDLPEEEGDEILVMLDADATLSVVFRDRLTPLSGLDSFVLGPSLLASLGLTPSNIVGEATTGAILSGRYVLRVTEPELWPVLVYLNVAPGSNEHAIQVRRVGAAEVLVARPSGLAVAGAAVHLHSVEFNHSIENWVLAGALTAPAGGLRTGPNGVFRITGVPNGTYRYSVVGLEGEVAEGELVVPPHGTARVEVELRPQ